MKRSTRPQVVYGVIALSFTLVLCTLTFFLFRFPWTWYHALAAWLAAVNLAAFLWYGYDKGQASRNGRRVPEFVLHGLAIAGGTLGAYLGMRFFRHKTIKSSFQFVFWFITVFQVLLILAVIYRVWKHG